MPAHTGPYPQAGAAMPMPVPAGHYPDYGDPQMHPHAVPQPDASQSGAPQVVWDHPSRPIAAMGPIQAEPQPHRVTPHITRSRA